MAQAKSLHDIWLENQLGMPDANERLMLKTAEGHRPITKHQLMSLISGAKSGERITVNGLTIVVGDDDTIQIIGTSAEPHQNSYKHEDLNKSASRQGKQSAFGDFLLNSFNNDMRRRSL